MIYRKSWKNWNGLTLGIRLVKNLNSCLPISKGLSSVVTRIIFTPCHSREQRRNQWVKVKRRQIVGSQKQLYNNTSICTTTRKVAGWENKISIGGWSQGWLQSVRESIQYISALGWLLRSLPTPGFYDFIRNLSLFSRLLYVQMFLFPSFITWTSIDSLQ